MEPVIGSAEQGGIEQAAIPELLLKGSAKPGLAAVARHLTEQQTCAQAHPAEADKQEQGHGWRPSGRSDPGQGGLQLGRSSETQEQHPAEPE
jgi:hypothetical protein